MFNYEKIDHGDGKGTGVSIENRNLAKGFLTLNFKDSEGRLLSVKLNSYTPINILVIYAPASATCRNTFIINAKNLINQNKIKHDIIAGDFNTIHECMSHYGMEIRKLIDEHNLVDTGVKENIATFPRSNKRLDRIYCNPNYTNNNNPLSVHQNTYNKSDHFPISINIEINNNNQTNNNIKYSNLPWTLCKETLETVTIHKELDKILEENKPNINTLEDWIKLKQKLRTYLKIKQNQIKKEKNKRKHVIHKLLENEDIYPKIKKELEKEIEEILKEEEMNKKWEVRKKLQLYQETPSKYLTSKLKMREKDRAIFQIKDRTGNTVSDKESIAKSFLEFYQNQYENKPDNEKVHKELLNKWTINHNFIKSLELDREITTEEVIQAIKTSSPHKSPGLDGINALFYRNHKESLAPLLANAFNDTLKNKREINCKFKEGFITTLFKKGDELQIANRRPITLLNTDYKLLSKIINKRLLSVTNKIINKFQNGFVPNRYIQDNIQIMKEIVDQSNKRKNETTLITFFDFNKAFDSLSHSSIKRTLDHIRVPEALISIIMNLLRDTNNKIKINDFMVEKVTVKRGTKQGDPLSPTIFALSMEPLLVSILEDKEIKGFNLDKDRSIKLTAFADDMSSFNKSTEELNKVIEKINNYCLGTSSLLNHDKTIMICIGNKPSNLPFKESTAPERYLGINFTKTGLHSKINTIIKSIKESLSKWKSQACTMKAKMAILKTYALSRLTYHQYIDYLEPPHIEELNNIIKWFLFSSIKYTYTEERKYRSLMTMDRAFAHWKEGGINMWDLSSRQEAFKIWSINRLLLLNKKKRTNTLHHWYIDQIKTWELDSMFIREQGLSWRNFRYNFFPNHPGIKEIPDCIRNKDGHPLSLKEIYYLIISQKYESIRRTEGQKTLMALHNINIPHIFEYINRISHQKGRNTLFRFFSRTLPGINYNRNTICKICNKRFTDPYLHLFIDCQHIKGIEKSITTTFNKLSIIKIKCWNLEAMEVCKTNKTEKVYPNLVGIITHSLWTIICYKLFNEDQDKKEPTFNPTTIENELNNLIKLEKFTLIKKLETYEKYNNDNNRNLLIYKFNTAWQNPINPLPVPI
ncbi:hypothetical protein ACTFIU_009539 [Dictyostelium citrinum]